MRYRSRLEARWASFFHALGIEAEYEPFELGDPGRVWMPDFLLRGAGARGDALAEIKPISDFCAATAAKVRGACRGKPLGADRLLLLGVSPFRADTGLCAGWVLHSGSDEWQLARVSRRDGRWRIGDEPAVQTGWRRVLAAVGLGRASDADLAGDTWRNACNVVQWRPGRQ